MYLGPRHRDEVFRKLDSIHLKTVEISQRVPDLLALVDAISVQDTSSSGSEDSGARQLEGVARTRALRISLGLGDEPNNLTTRNITEQRTIDPDLTLPIELEFRKLALGTSSDTANAREIAKYDEDPVYVEWKTIRDRRQIRKLKPRIQALCRLLRAPKPSSFRSLRCRGVAEIVGQDRFAMVFDMPASCELSGFASTLQDCIMWQSYRPSASVRKSLALQLCTTVLHLHTAGWVHKAIRSRNINFFYPKKPEALHEENLLGQPFLVGYEYARFDDPSQSSELQSSAPGVDIYRHPDILGGEPCTFTKEHDIYALGLLLLEIGTWARLQDLLSLFVDLGKDPTSPKIRQVRDYILERVERPTGYTVLQLLRFRMGDVYTDIVESCLDGASFRDTNLFDSPSTPTEHFNDLVVGRLASYLI